MNANVKRLCGYNFTGKILSSQNLVTNSLTKGIDDAKCYE